MIVLQNVIFITLIFYLSKLMYNDFKEMNS